MRKALTLILVGGCCAVGVIDPAPPDRFLRSSMQLHDLLHVPAFTMIAALLLVGFPARPEATIHRRIVRLVLIFATSVALGVLVEAMQFVGGGDADVWDVLRDAAGALAAVLLAAAFWPEMQARASARWALRAAAALTVAACALPTLFALVDESSARRHFPLLADFSSRLERGRFTATPWSTLVRVCPGEPDGSDGCFARVSLRAGQYPGFALRYFPRDWRGYRYFVLSCANPSTTVLPIAIRIDDMHHNNEYRDRFNAAYTLAPGTNEIRVPLGEVEKAPRGRTLDLARVRSVIVFAYRLRQPRELVVQSLRLE